VVFYSGLDKDSMSPVQRLALSSLSGTSESLHREPLVCGILTSGTVYSNIEEMFVNSITLQTWRRYVLPKCSL
jgi:hypothetical protein